ncbi:MAG: hypothetical protein GY716_00515 [bacterium]|nr:hypothetical protein [bacterium]
MPPMIRYSIMVLTGLALLLLGSRLVIDAAAGIRQRGTLERIEDKYGPLDPSSLARETPPADSDNRVLPIRAAAEAMVLSSEGQDSDRNLVGEISRFRSPEIEARDLERLRGIVESNSIVFDLLDQAVDRPDADWDLPYHMGFATEIPKLIRYVSMSKLLAASARFHITDGNVDQASRSIVSGLTVASTLGAESVLIMQLVRLSATQWSLAALRELLATHELDERTLERLARAIDEATVPDGIVRGLMGEMKGMHSAFVQMEHGKHLPMGDEAMLERNAAVRWIMRPLTRLSHQSFLTRMDRMVQYTDLPPPRRRIAFPTHPLEEEFSWWDVQSKIMLPNLANAVNRADVHAARVMLAQTAVALERFRLRHGAYPAELGALDASGIDPYTGRLPIYSRDASGYTLESSVANADPTTYLGTSDPILVWTVKR